MKRPIDTALDDRAIGKRLVRNSGFLFSSKTASAVIGLLVLVVLSKVLAPSQLGALLLLHAYVTLISGVASFKSWQLVIRHGKSPETPDDVIRFHKLLRFSIGLDVTSAIAGMAIALAALPFAYTFVGLPHELLGAGLAYCLLIPLNIRSTPVGVLRILDRFDIISAHQMIMPCVRLIGALAGLLLQAELMWFIIVWFVASLASHASLPLLALRELHHKKLMKGLFAKPPSLRAPEKGMWRFAWFSNLDSSLDLASQHLPTLLVSAIFDPAFAALFKIAREIASLFSEGARQIDRVLYPELARLVVADARARIFGLITRASLIIVAIGLTLSAALGFMDVDLLAIAFGEAYRGAAWLAVLLLIAASFQGAAMPFFSALYAEDTPNKALLARSGGVILFLLLIPVFSNTHGQIGIGWAAITGEIIGLSLAGLLAVRSLQALKPDVGQSARNAAQTRVDASCDAGDTDKSGGPGQPGSAKASPSNSTSLE